MLVNFQTKSMTSAMKESDASAFANPGRKTAPGEKFMNRLMDRHPVHTGFDPFQSQRLSGFHRVPKLALRVAGSSAQNRAGHVAEISCLRVARENIQDNERIGVKRSVAALMRVARLVAAGDDCACRNAARAQNRRINFRAKRLGSER